MSSIMPESVKNAGGLSLTAIARLERRFAEALRNIPAARVNLRLAVRHLVVELEAQSVSSEAIRRLVTFVADHHPQRDDLDRTSMVTGIRESDRVLGQMLGWVDELYGV